MAVPQMQLGFAVAVFEVLAVCCLGVLCFRRRSYGYELVCMLKMPVLAAAQLASTASSERDSRFQAALHNQEEAQSHAARSDGLGCCHEAGPKSAIFTFQYPGTGRLSSRD